MAHLWFMVCSVLGVCCLGVYSSLPLSSNADVRLFVTSKGINYVHSMLLKDTVNEIKGLAIPPVVIRKKYWWSNVRLGLTNSKVHTVKMGTSFFRFQNGLLKLSMQINEMDLGGNYYCSGFFPGSGTYTIKMSRVFITKYLSIERDSEGKPLIVTKGCVTRIGETKVMFIGGSSMILNLVLRFLKKSVQNDVQKLICKSISSAIEEKTKSLPAAYPGFITLGPCGQVNFPIVTQPVVKTGHVEFSLEGGVNSSCYALTNSSNKPGVVGGVHYVPSPYKTMTFLLGDQFFNSLTELYYYDQLLNMTMGVVQQNDTMQVSIDVTSPPIIQTTVMGSRLTLYAKATANMTSIKHQTAEINVVISGKLSLGEENGKLSGTVTDLRISSPSLAKDTKIAPQIKQQVMHFIRGRKKQVTNSINSFLYRFAPLPLIDGMTLIYKHLNSRQGYTILMTDIKI